MLTPPYVIAIKTKEKTNLVHAAIIDNETTAFWLKHPIQTSYRYCSQCFHIHQKSDGSLLDCCPSCNTKMIKGSAAKEYYELIAALVKEGNNQILFVKNDKNFKK